MPQIKLRFLVNETVNFRQTSTIHFIRSIGAVSSAVASPDMWDAASIITLPLALEAKPWLAYRIRKWNSNQDRGNFISVSIVTAEWMMELQFCIIIQILHVKKKNTDKNRPRRVDRQQILHRIRQNQHLNILHGRNYEWVNVH